jgi:hypothetical protein
VCVRERERGREREIYNGSERVRESEREKVPRNLSICLINRYLQYLTKKAATFLFFVSFFPHFFFISRLFCTKSQRTFFSSSCLTPY